MAGMLRVVGHGKPREKIEVCDEREKVILEWRDWKHCILVL